MQSLSDRWRRGRFNGDDSFLAIMPSENQTYFFNDTQWIIERLPSELVIRSLCFLYVNRYFILILIIHVS